MNPLSPSGDDVDHPLTTKEGWTRFLTEHIDPPNVLAPSALQQLKRKQYDTAREHYHARLVIVSTPAIRHIAGPYRRSAPPTGGTGGFAAGTTTRL